MLTILLGDKQFSWQYCWFSNFAKKNKIMNISTFLLRNRYLQIQKNIKQGCMVSIIYVQWSCRKSKSCQHKALQSRHQYKKTTGQRTGNICESSFPASMEGLRSTSQKLRRLYQARKDGVGNLEAVWKKPCH